MGIKFKRVQYLKKKHRQNLNLTKEKLRNVEGQIKVGLEGLFVVEAKRLKKVVEDEKTTFKTREF